MKKERRHIEFNRRLLEGRIKKVKDVLPLVEQLIQFRIEIGEVLAFRSAVFEKADVEKIPGQLWLCSALSCHCRCKHKVYAHTLAYMY
jgi:hypothetical protein